MSRSTLLIAAVAAAGVLAAPASALAAGSLYAGPVKVKGYDVTLSATDSGASDSLSVYAIRKKGVSSQTHSWTLESPKVTIKGSKATIKGSFAGFGSINAKVSAGRKAKGTVPKGCTGKAGSARKGTLSGKTKLVLDSSFFGTLKPKSMPAQILKAGKLDCSGAGSDGGAGGGGGGKGGLTLTSSADGGDGQLMVTASKVGKSITQSVMLMPEDAPGASVMHMISAPAKSGDFTAAGDLSSATVRGAGGFLSGTLSFTGEPMGSMSSGTVSGDFAAAFDSVGTQRLPDGNDAMLMGR